MLQGQKTEQKKNKEQKKKIEHSKTRTEEEQSTEDEQNEEEERTLEDMNHYIAINNRKKNRRWTTNTLKYNFPDQKMSTEKEKAGCFWLEIKLKSFSSKLSQESEIQFWRIKIRSGKK